MAMKINKALQFSQKYINGSPQKKREMVSQYNDRIYERICSHISQETDSFRSCDALEDIQAILPEKKRIDIKNIPFKLREKFDGSSDFIYDKHDNIVGQTLELPVKKGKIQGIALPTFMHEMTHILDNFVNPKYNARAEVCERKGLYGKAYDRVYEKLYEIEKYNNETEKASIIEERRQDVLKLLKGKSVEDKIDLVQDLRYSLETEQNAYREQARFANKMFSEKREVNPHDLKEYEQSYMFEEKLQMLKEIGLDIVQSFRKKFAKQLNKNV
ncbi:MAG: hypothetical protein NC200_03935 [Candidatus Gastranaerophilales bacterium]|nr:hypothetical protein [Candidatus Gastranaerophilales bacterium]